MPDNHSTHDARFQPGPWAQLVIVLITLAAAFFSIWFQVVNWPYSGHNTWGGTFDWTAFGHILVYGLVAIIVSWTVYYTLQGAVIGSKRLNARIDRVANLEHPEEMSDLEIQMHWHC